MSKDNQDIQNDIKKIEEKIQSIKNISDDQMKLYNNKIHELKKRAFELKARESSDMTRLEQIKISRSINRPKTSDIIKNLCSDFIEFRGDRLYGDDSAIIGGIGEIEGRPFTIIGHQKGNNTKENIYRNFGMAHPEGYRKAMRLMKQAEKFRRPVITLIDTPGAYPGIGAEERGQAEAIARNLYLMSDLRTIIIAFIIGEGGSGGALAIGIADKVYMLKNSMYSVISPEGCASILWKDPALASNAIEALKPMADDLHKFGIIDGVIDEAYGGFQEDPQYTIHIMKHKILSRVIELEKLPVEQLLEKRYEKYRNIGQIKEEKK